MRLGRYWNIVSLHVVITVDFIEGAPKKKLWPEL